MNKPILVFISLVTLYVKCINIFESFLLFQYNNYYILVPPEVHVTGMGANKSNDGMHFTARHESPFNFTCSVIANPFVNITINRNNEWFATIGRNNLNETVLKLNEHASGAYEYMFIMNFKSENEPYMYSVTITGHLANSAMFSVHKCMSFNNYGSDEKLIDIIKIDN